MAQAAHIIGQAVAGAGEQYIEVAGSRVHYVHEGAGRPLVLIHGLTGSTVNWRKNMAALARERSVYAIDLMNMGQSDRVAGLDASLAATADRVADFMDAVGLDEADIAGHSHGGAIALMLAARHPRRVRSLQLFAPANPFCDFGHSLIRLYNSAPGRLLARSIPYLPSWVHGIALGRMYGDPARISEGSLAGYMDGLAAPGSIEHVLAIVRGWHADMAALRAALPQVAAVPTLLVWGTRDRAVSLASATELQRELPNSELRVLPTGGHIVFEELPEECNRIMVEWLQQEPVARAQPVAIRPVRVQSAKAGRMAIGATLRPVRKSF